MGRLFWKIFLAFWLALVAAAVGTGTMVWLQRRALEGAEGELALAPPHRIAIDMAAATLRHGGVEALREWMKGMEIEATKKRRPVPLFAVDDDGDDLLGRAVPQGALARARSLTAQPSGEPGARLVQTPDGKKYLLFVPTAAAAQLPPPPEIIYKGPEQPFREGLPPGAKIVVRREPPPPWALIAIGVATSLGFSAALAWYLARPIRSLRWAFDAAASGRLDARVTPRIGRRRDEIADLGRDFDRMAERLQASIATQKRLLHDVSHELRSPLARLQAAIGLLQQKDPANLDTSLARIEKESARLDVMIGEVLTLARLESGNFQLGTESVDVAELVGEIAEDARFEAETQEKSLTFESAPEARVRGRADVLYRALENVVRNAVKYTPEGTTVGVSLQRDGPDICVTVSDAGPGIPADHLEHIFEPFYRGRSERDRDGFGLGLAIAHRAITAHGGSISVANASRGGLRVEVRLPAVTKG